jgi:hypothetical protein
VIRREAVSPNTASRLLGTLESPGMAQRDDQGPFPLRLGLGLVMLADRVLERLDLRAVGAGADLGAALLASVAFPIVSAWLAELWRRARRRRADAIPVGRPSKL